MRNVKKLPTNLYTVRMFGRDLTLTEYYARMITEFNEVAMWERYYLPVDLTGKVVLDVGAGEGETALFFLSHGAKSIIAIEPNDEAFALLRLNTSGLNVMYRQDRFSLRDLDLAYDVMKMDIEGGEALLLDAMDNGKPMVVEVHSRELAMKLKDKFQLQIVNDVGENVVIMNRPSHGSM